VWSKRGDSFAGDVTIDVYDLTGNPLQHIDATIRAVRITTGDDPKQIGLPGFPTSPKCLEAPSRTGAAA
jgi:hypothetical protein